MAAASTTRREWRPTSDEKREGEKPRLAPKPRALCSPLHIGAGGPGGPLLKARSLAKTGGAARTSRPAMHPMPQRLRRLTDAPVLAKTVLFSLARMGLVTSQSRWVTSSKSNLSTCTLGLRASRTPRDASIGAQAARSAHTPGRAPCLAVRSADQPCGPARDTPNRSDSYPGPRSTSPTTIAVPRGTASA
jgi:hypothetical protein